jgi:hypothetical protein
MYEGTPSDNSLLRVIAVYEAIDLRKIEIVLDDRIGDIDHAGILDRLLHAVGRARM